MDQLHAAAQLAAGRSVAAERGAPDAGGPDAGGQGLPQVLNMALFGRTATEWKRANPSLAGNMRDHATLEQLVVLSNMESINAVRQKPRFYNTLTSNCTNLIWAHARMNPRRIPFSWKILLSGHAPSYLYDQGRLDTSLPFDTLMKSSLINAIAQAAGDASDFSQRIRTVLHPAGKTP